jgi:hypothetical protein
MEERDYFIISGRFHSTCACVKSVCVGALGVEREEKGGGGGGGDFASMRNFKVNLTSNTFSFNHTKIQRNFLKLRSEWPVSKGQIGRNISFYCTLPIPESRIDSQMNRVGNFSSIKIMDQCTTAGNSKTSRIPAYIHRVTIVNITITHSNQNSFTSNRISISYEQT